jgi:DNA-binding transcriptional LysR family regulator
LARFRREHPDIQLQVRELRPARAIAQAVADGEADLGFVHLPFEVQGLEHRVLLNDPFVVVVPEGHPLARKRILSLAEIADQDWVWVREANEPDHPLYAACTAVGFRPRIVCESGIALLPNLAVEARAGLRRVRLEPAPGRTLAVIWSPDKLEPAAAAFLRLCEAPAIGS